MGLQSLTSVRALVAGPKLKLQSLAVGAVLVVTTSLSLLFAGEAAAGAPPKPGEQWTIPNLELALAPIPAGTFAMGSPEAEKGRDPGEGPQTKVTFTKGFWLGATEVTQKQWESLMEGNPSQFKKDDNPVEKISWSEAVAYCEKLTSREKAAGRLPAGYVYALPTEAQWEYACRAGSTGEFYGKLADIGWYFKNTEGLTTKPVAQKQANAWGLFDTHGNVWEWCADCYGKYPGGAVTDPKSAATGLLRVARGGGWGDSPTDCRAAFRVGYKPEMRGNSIGFRVALRPAP